MNLAMKSPPLLLLVLLTIVLPSPTRAADATITLAWDYPTNELSMTLTFKLYHSETLTLPAAQWTVLTNIPGTSLQVTVPVTISQHYFYLTASNWWGESDPSNVASTPAPPRSGRLTIHRGPTTDH